MIFIRRIYSYLACRVEVMAFARLVFASSSSVALARPFSNFPVIMLKFDSAALRAANADSYFACALTAL